MPIEFVYLVVKDLIALAKMEEAEPIDPGTLEREELVAMGISDGEAPDAYSWAAPRNLFKCTEAPNAAYEIVWVMDNLHRKKRRVVRLTHDGKLDLVLIRKKGS